MIIQDEIYGQWDLNDPLLIELANSKPVQRLKQISNDGANRYIFEVGDPTRYKHSMGVLYLSLRFSKKRENHIMALLHDVAHSAFSHVVDFVFGQGDTQDIHEVAKQIILEESEIKEILKRHNYNVEIFFEKENYPMVGNSKSQVNIDRIDYFLRDGFGIGLIDISQIKFYLKISFMMS